MTGFNIHPQAIAEFDEAFEHYLAIDATLATSFETTVFKYLREIIASPLRFGLRKSPTRRVNLTPRFGAYYIAYMIWKDKPVILAIAHGARRPYYWRKRIGEAKKLF
jgi:plasmid stabilization system protein ParE